MSEAPADNPQGTAPEPQVGRIGLWHYSWFTALAIVGAGVDLWTKHLMFHWSELRAGQVYWLIPNIAGFQLSLNEGALFGMGQGQQGLFAALSFLAALAIPIWLFRFGAAADRWITLALGGVMGGVIGNLYDRLGLPGELWQWPPERVGQPVYAVRDWILLQAGDQYRWPNFNIADALLVVGAIVLFWRAAIAKEPTEDA